MLRKFWEDYPDSEAQLRSWHYEVRQATWKSPADIKVKYRSASIIDGERVVFNICGNKYRLVVRINYSVGIVFTKFVGTHSEYDKLDVRRL